MDNTAKAWERELRIKGEFIVPTYTASYTKLDDGYMGQLVEWPQVLTEGRTIDECREMLKDAAHEMMIVSLEDGHGVPKGDVLFERLPIEVPTDWKPSVECK